MEQIRTDMGQAVTELLSVSGLAPGQILLLGGSTSEVAGQRVGTASNLEIAHAVLDGVIETIEARDVFLAVQCCEHLNRCLVVEEDCARQYGLEPVTVLPVPKAGGALASVAMERFERPVVVESIRAHAGLDIGAVLIGMHLRPVAVPVRLAIKRVGEAILIAARTRPKLVGGARAVYPDSQR
ncbi:MAG: TIGR01440 family protein [Symbiobacteriia bacterium]